MENSSNRQIDITWDIMHTLAVEFNVTLKEINRLVWSQVYDIIWWLIKNHPGNDKQRDLFHN